MVPLACGKAGHHTATTTTLPALTTTVAPTTTTAPPVRYQVKRGDTLSAIAAHFHLTQAAILAANHLTNPNQLAVGQVLTIPVPPPAPAPATTVAGGGSGPSQTAAPGQTASLAITPGSGAAGLVFNLKLTGAKPGETVTFTIVRPDGTSFTGPAHTAGADGVVSAGYATSGSDPTGAYRVTAKGDHGTTAQATFQVTETPTSSP